MRILMTLALLLAHSVCWSLDHLELLLSREEISTKVVEMARQVDRDYAGQKITILMVLKSAICITSDLMKELQTPFKYEAISASSYGENGTHSGDLIINGLDALNLEGEHVLIIDDIFDTGKTMSSIVERVKAKNPLSVKSLVLLLKNVKHTTLYRPDYIIFEIENRFVVGYGMDYKEYYRGLPGLYAFIGDIPPVDIP